MDLPDEVTVEIRNRLRRAVGQVQAVERMLGEGRDCKEIVTQLTAATKALEQAAFRMVAAGLTYCVEDPDRAAAEGYDLEVVERMFMRLA